MENYTLYGLGLFLCTKLLYQFLRFIIPYIRPSKIEKYLLKDSYALVTVATDGIGKAMTAELAGKGFNIILHGRNSDKLLAVENQIKSENQACKVISLTHDGSVKGPIDISLIKGLTVTVLVNNVGAGPIDKLINFSDNLIEETITLNAIFPSQLTRNLLPYLYKRALILNVSSYAGLFPPPYLAVYAGTKAYNNAFSVSLSRELENNEIISLITGSVHTGSNKKKISLMRPSAATYARHVLKIVGCKRKSIMPYWPHAVQAFIISLIPDFLFDSMSRKTLKKEIGK